MHRKSLRAPGWPTSVVWLTVCLAPCLRINAQTPVPAWAFPGCLRSSAATVDADRPISVPDSAIRYTRAAIANWSVTVDWFPKEHAVLPPVLAASRVPAKPACGYCHLADGTGRPENAKLAGLPAAYIVAQVHALHAGMRAAAAPGWLPTTLMRNATAELTEEEIGAAAAYFSEQRPRSFVTVVEQAEVPLYETACFVYRPMTESADSRHPNHSAAGPRLPTVPLESAIIELPASFERFEARDPHVAYTAYVPPGSIARGRRLARGASPNGVRFSSPLSCSILRG